MQGFENQRPKLPSIFEDNAPGLSKTDALELSGASGREVFESAWQRGKSTTAPGAPFPPPTADVLLQETPGNISSQRHTAKDSYDAEMRNYGTEHYDPHRYNDTHSVANSRLSQVYMHMPPRALVAKPLQTIPPLPVIPSSLGAEQSVLLPLPQGIVVHDDDMDKAKSPSIISRASADVDENEQHDYLSEVSRKQFTSSERSANSCVAEQMGAMRTVEARIKAIMQVAQKEDVDMAPDPEMIRELETRSITGNKLIEEVEGIYKGIVAVEKKCIEVVEQQMLRVKNALAEKLPMPQLSSEQWKALNEVHTALLSEHHNFFLASFHPSSPKALRNLSQKYAMPSRMWKHGIHAYLELLRTHIAQPDVHEHASAFITVALNHFALFKETVPGDTNVPESEQVAPNLDLIWIEGLGDLARYKMGLLTEKIERDRKLLEDLARDKMELSVEEIERSHELLGDLARRKMELSVDENERDHWNRVAASHYQEVVARTPTVGRLFHHLAILASDPFEHLGLLGKSLSVAEPFPQARNIILSFEVNRTQGFNAPLSGMLARIQKSLLSGSTLNRNDITTFFIELKSIIVNESRHFRELGPHLASALLAGVVGFGAEDNDIMRGLVPIVNKDGSLTSASSLAIPKQGGHDLLQAARDLAFGAFDSVVTCFNDPTYFSDSDLLPFLHVFMNYLQGTLHLAAGQAAASDRDWANIVLMLNRLADQHQSMVNLIHSPDGAATPSDEGGCGRLPEDITMLGAAWNSDPDSVVFSRARHQLASHEDIPETEPSQAQDQARRERILRFAVQLAQAGTCPRLGFDAQTSHFYVHDVKGKSAISRG